MHHPELCFEINNLKKITSQGPPALNNIERDNRTVVFLAKLSVFSFFMSDFCGNIIERILLVSMIFSAISMILILPSIKNITIDFNILAFINAAKQDHLDLDSGPFHEQHPTALARRHI
jgi:hypothetical protein